MAENPGARFVVPGHVVVRELPDCTMLLNGNTGRWFTLDAIGAVTWRLLRDAGSLDEVCRVLTEDYDAAGDIVRRDVASLIERLLSTGLLERRDD